MPVVAESGRQTFTWLTKSDLIFLCCAHSLKVASHSRHQNSSPMNPLWFPCRVCGMSTEGIDSYVVCAGCLRDFDNGVSDGVRLYDNLAHAPLTSDDEVRVRKLLDW